MPCRLIPINHSRGGAEVYKKYVATCLLLLFWAATLGAGPIQVLKVEPSGVQYSTLQVVETKKQSLEGLQLWSSIPKDQILGFWSEEPDFKENLLQKGFAQLKDPAAAPPHLREAQESAKSAGLGIWAKPSSPPRPTQPTPAPVGTASAPFAPDLKWLGVVARAIFAIIAFIGGGQVIYLVWAYFHRQRVSLILLGEPNTGKSWLWYRLVDPTLQEAGLRKVRKSDARAELKHSKIPMGKFEIFPIYTDIPGSRSGEQLTELLDRKWFRSLQRLLLPQKRVWLIVLAPAVDLSSGKIDQGDLNEQYGALKMYAAVVASRKTPKPDFVAICIAKADLFMERPPSDSTSQAAQAELLREFHPHTTLLEKTCKAHGVRTEVIICSALRAWGTDRILKALERACYTGK